MLQKIKTSIKKWLVGEPQRKRTNSKPDKCFDLRRDEFNNWLKDIPEYSCYGENTNREKNIGRV